VPFHAELCAFVCRLSVLLMHQEVLDEKEQPF